MAATTPPAPTARVSKSVETGCKRAFTRAKQTLFLDTLATTLNVPSSAEAAGIGRTAVHRHRRIDADFRQAWEAAIEAAYAELEIASLDRALNGRRKQVERDGMIVETVEYSDTLALNLLAHHRRAVAESRAVQGPPREDVAVLRARLIAKITAMMAPLPEAGAP